MESLKSTLVNNSYSNSKKIYKTIAIAIDDSKIDFILDNYTHLYPQEYRKWHAKFIKQHGDDVWVRCAKTAEQEGRDPQRYFTWLLKRCE